MFNNFRRLLTSARLSNAMLFYCSYVQRNSVSKTSILNDVPSHIPRNVVDLFKGIVDGERSHLASAITLVESLHPRKKEEARALLTLALLHAKNRYQVEGPRSLSFRIGLTGPPGAGKSTFIEVLGKLLTENGNKVAVLTVDPSSKTTGGSILGDKVRMPDLARDNHAYIRSSPSSGHLGGVTRNTNESIVLCESAGYNVVIVETVGVGQSEADVADMVDMFVLLVPPAGGDELQALKKGVGELVDMIVVNKYDGDLMSNVRRTQAEYLSALKFMKKPSKNYNPQVLKISSKTKEGIAEMWEEMCHFRDTALKSGEFEQKRKQQYKTWIWKHIQSSLLLIFKSHPNVQNLLPSTQDSVEKGVITPGEASDYLIKKFLTCYVCGTSL